MGRNNVHIVCSPPKHIRLCYLPQIWKCILFSTQVPLIWLSVMVENIVDILAVKKLKSLISSFPSRWHDSFACLNVKLCVLWYDNLPTAESTMQL